MALKRSVFVLKGGKMDKILHFFGTILGVFDGPTNNLVGSCAIVCMILKFLFATMTNRYYSIPVLSEELKPQLDNIKKKYAKTPEKLTKAISDFLVSVKYPFASFAVYYLSMLAIGTFIALATHSPEKYVEGFAPEASRAFLMIPDVTEYTIVSLKSLWPDINMLRYMILPVLACVLQYVQDAYMSKKSLVSKTWFDYSSLAVTFAACLMLPQTFSVFWFIYELGNMIHITTNIRLAKNKNVKTKRNEK